MANPKKPENKKAKTTGISLPLPLIQAAKKRAFDEGKTLSSLIRELLTAHLR